MDTMGPPRTCKSDGVSSNSLVMRMCTHGPTNAAVPTNSNAMACAAACACTLQRSTLHRIVRTKQTHPHTNTHTYKQLTH
jgi:hypothetical protein